MKTRYHWRSGAPVECLFLCDECGKSATRYEIDLDSICDRYGDQVNLCLECEKTEMIKQRNGQEAKYYAMEIGQ